MNLLASYNWIREYVKTPLDAQGFAKRVSLSGPGVERLYPQASQFAHIRVGCIKRVGQHPNADKLRIATTDLGDRDLDIVCGGSNLAENMLVAVALSGARVRWHGQGDPITLEPTEIRGVKSEAMICGASEIGLASAFPHAEKEILDITWTNAKPGTTLAVALDLDDTIMDIEVTTNRPDAFSIVGMAREAAAILDEKFLAPKPDESILKAKKKTLELSADVKTKLCERYTAIALTGITVAPSPWWLKQRLIGAGLTPINNVIDITNYVMLEYGQPLHAFDYAKVSGGDIVVREAKEGESIMLLDGKSHNLTKGTVMIADNTALLAVAGVMGGQESAIANGTTSIIIESATFDPVATRRAARSINQHTDAALRFEKGLPPEQTSIALARAVELLKEICGAEVASPLVDIFPEKPKPVHFTVRTEKISQLIGIDVPEKKIVAHLEALGFETKPKSAGTYTVTVPYWRRRDIEGERDFAEEVARLIGYAALPSVLPSGELPNAPQDPLIVADERMKSAYKEAGFTELVQYSFVSADLLKKAGVAEEHAIRLANPLTSDFVFMRPSLIPSTLHTIAENQERFPSGKLFEVAKVYPKMPENADIPPQIGIGLAVSYGHDDTATETPWRELKGIFESLVGAAMLARSTASRVEDESLWHPGRTIRYAINGAPFAVLGELHPTLCKKFGIAKRVVALAVQRETLAAIGMPQLSYVPTPPFPPALRDLALVIAEDAEYANIRRQLFAVSTFLKDVELFDIFRGPAIGTGKKSLALHLTFSDPAATLTTETIDEELEHLRAALKTLGATPRS